MEVYFFSATTNTFYMESMKDDYVMAGTWPSDAIEVSEAVFQEYCGQPPSGKTRGADDSGMPAWVDLPPRSDEDIIVGNTGHKQFLIKEASQEISILTDATDPNIVDPVDPNDVALLREWKLYRIALNKVTDMLNPVWPKQPNA